jgi:ABC-type nitrate/sulfonate/bicarbonate transport system permease component
MTETWLERQERQREQTSRMPPRPAATWRARLRRAVPSALVFVAVLAFLQWGVPALGVSPYVLPTPWAVLQRMLDPESRLLYHFGITAFEAVGGVLVGGLLGVTLAVLFIHVRPLENALYPWIIVLQTIPLVALAPMLIIWFGSGVLPRVAMSALFAFFPILVNALRGLRQTEPAAMELLRTYAASRWQIFWTLRLPSSLPFVFAGLKIGTTLAVIGAIVGEFAGASQGLGYAITVSTYSTDTSQTFAAIAYASLMGISLYLLLLWLERRLVFWQRGA